MALPHLPVPALHARVPQYLACRFWQIAATLPSEALAPFDLMPWQVALLAQLRCHAGARSQLARRRHRH